MERQPVDKEKMAKYFKKKEPLPTILETADGLIDDIVVDNLEIERKMEELDKKYEKNEYNCHKKHHNNPKTIAKLNQLLQGHF